MSRRYALLVATAFGLSCGESAPGLDPLMCGEVSGDDDTHSGDVVQSDSTPGAGVEGDDGGDEDASDGDSDLSDGTAGEDDATDSPDAGADGPDASDGSDADADGSDARDGGTDADALEPDVLDSDTEDAPDADGQDGQPDEGPGEPDTGPPAPVCGDGKIEEGEACEGDVTCASLNGELWTGLAPCVESCTVRDTSDCRTKLGTKEHPAPSCADIPGDGVDDPIGLFWLDTVDGPVQVWCDLVTGGGGWTLVSNRPYAELPGTWGEFTEGTLPVTPNAVATFPFLWLFPEPTAVRLSYTGNGQSVTRAVAPGAEWEKSGKGLRIALADGNYLIFSDQPAAPGDSPCITTGTFDTGFKCDGNDGQLDDGQGLFSAFAEDEFCNCKSWAWKNEAGTCEASVCSPPAPVSVYLR